VSGVIVAIDTTRASGSRIVALRLADGRELSDSKTYKVIMNNFIAEGGSNLGPPAEAKQTPLGIIDIDALVDYIKTLKSPLVAPAEPRITLTKPGG
jgi:5'-nucleotidase